MPSIHSNSLSELNGVKVFVTGHTGFTGAWTSIWLQSLGAKVFGYSLSPETTPNLYTAANLSDVVPGQIADIRNYASLNEAMDNFQPDVVLHLAAQPLVLRSYRSPKDTFEINTLGTINVIEAARNTKSVKGVLCITTDKVYSNLEIDYAYKEQDRLGGEDPYSASKAAAELAIYSFRKLINNDEDSRPLIAVARGGNIIGGGDWSEDRIVPDFIRAYETGTELEVRYPDSTRPWQHVLALVEGYLQILSGLVGPNSAQFAQAFNLGPLDQQNLTVRDFLTQLSSHICGVQVRYKKSNSYEAGKLGIDSTLASETFGWNPRWTTQESIEKTAEWYLDFMKNPASALELCHKQINSWLNSQNQNQIGRS